MLERSSFAIVMSLRRIIELALLSTFSLLGANKCMTSKPGNKYSNKVRKLLPSRGGLLSRVSLFTGFFSPRLSEASKRRIFQRLKLSDVYRFSRWRFILASKVFRGAAGTRHSAVCPPYLFSVWDVAKVGSGFLFARKVF